MVEIITRCLWKNSKWAGGETNELYIYPSGSSYRERNFMARISVANTYGDGKSEFTSLPGIDRFISVLEGEMTLTFEEKYTCNLKPFDIENFSGDCAAFSIGKYVDFNLMLQNCKGELFFEAADREFVIDLKETVARLFLFIIEGEITIGEHILNKCDLLITDQNRLSVFADQAKFFYGYFK